MFYPFLPLSPPGWRGIVVTVRVGGRLPNLRNPYLCNRAWRIFSIRSSVALSRPVGVHCHGHMPIGLIWACLWAKNLLNLQRIGSRLCGRHISETAGWIYPILSFMDLSRPVVVQRHSYLPICPIWACPWAKNLSNETVLGPDFAEPISLKPLHGFIPFEVLWNCLDLYSCATSWSFDIDTGFSRSNFENAVSQEWRGRLTWNERDVNR